MPSSDKKRLSAVQVHVITGKGQVSAGGVTIPCDLLCMSTGYMPVYQLLCQAGAKLNYNDDSARFLLTNLPKNLYVAGSANGVHELDAVISDGQLAAYKSLTSLGSPSSEPKKVLCAEQTNFPWPIFKHPQDKDFVDFDEDLQAKDIVNATRLGYPDIQLVKRFSTVGMGPSQSRHSALPTARLVATAMTETGVTTARSHFVPEKLAHIAGRILSPHKYTPMHKRHVELGAHMIPAGIWRRPAYYGHPDNRDKWIQQEAQMVRNAVGMIDVSTLGGLEVRGPNTAELTLATDRFYPFASHYRLIVACA